MSTQYRVSEVAAVAHVTVRTLHHYDEIGLLVPSGRSGAGYRLYSQADLERLHQILLYRELGFALDAIADLLDAPALDRHAALRAQRQLLLEERRRTDAVIRAVDRTLASMDEGRMMTTGEIFDGFDDLAQAPPEVRAHHRAHAAEAHERWGDSDAYRESARRAKAHSKQDWKQIQDEAAANEARMIALLAAGERAEGEAAMDAAEAMRLHIGRWFYPCSHTMHVGLADMYEADPRFAAYYEERAAGLAAYTARAIRANAARAADGGGEPRPDA